MDNTLFSNRNVFPSDSVMYGVPANLDLSHYLNATCTQVAIGEFQIQLRFHPEASISVDGRWELRDADGHIVDQSVDNDARETFRLHLLLGKAVVDSDVLAPDSFRLVFKTGHVLEIFDESDQYESCQLSPSGVII